MKEQVITPRAGRGAAAGKGRAGESAQKPARRERGQAAKSRGWRKASAYLPLAGKITLAVVLGLLLFAGYRAAASASFFQARSIDVAGTSRASSDEIKQIVKRSVAQTGVWRADLAAISRELKSVAWVREAVVSRVLPDGLRVRVVEREPRAIIRTEAGKFLWVDDEAVTVGAASPADQIIMRGWDEAGTDVARSVNRERVQKFLEMAREWEASGIGRRVSEINLNDPRDVRVELTGDDSHIEIQLGGEEFGPRLRFALGELDRQRATPIGPFIQHINVAQGIEKGRHVTIGVSPDAPNFSAASPAEAGGPEVESAEVSVRHGASASRPSAEARKAKVADSRAKEAETRRTKEKTARAEEEQQARKRERAKKEKDKKEKSTPAAKTESRPRRVS